jgi:hypothetical protein
MIETKLYDNKETLLFDPIPHKYFWNNEPIISATAITKLLTPASMIGNWSSKMCAEKFKTLIQAGTAYDEIQLIDFYEKIKKAPNSSMSNAGVIGGQVHDLIENYIHNKKEPTIHNTQMKKSFDIFKQWYDSQEGLELVFTERKVLSRIHKYCGTLDALFKKNNEYIIYDWKTSSGIRDSYYIQIYLYAICIEEEFGFKVPKGVIVNCTKEGKLRIAEFDIDSDNHDTALSCLKLYRFKPQKKENK